MIKGFLAMMLLAGLAAGNLFDPTKSPVHILNKGNFNHQIKKMHLDSVKVVNFFAPYDGHSRSFVADYEKTAKDMKGILRLFAVDCSENAQLCKEHDVSTYPTIKVFPPGLLVTSVYEGERNQKDLVKFATRFVGNFATQVKGDSEAAFLNKNPAMAKVLLFTDKPGTPLLYKGLSVEFKDKLLLGVVKSDEKALTSKYRVSKFPTVLVLVPGQKPLKYEGKIEFQPLFDFLNRYQETFALNKASDEDAPEKPWLSETIPELTSLSGDDVCFRFDGICVVAVVRPSAEGKLEKSLQDVLVNVKAKFERQINRGAKFSFTWLNSETEPAFAKGVELSDSSKLPGFVALKLGKRNRFAALEGEFTEENINKFLDRVLGGDARYSPLNPIPALTPKEKPKGKK